jgi:hypothetical protein
LSEDFNPSDPLSSLTTHPELGFAVLQKPPITDFSAFRGEPPKRINVPSEVADFFIEGFAVDQPASTKAVANKTFPKPITLKFSLPAIVPISVSSVEQGKVQFGFYETPLLSVAETEQRVNFILSAIARKETYVVDFTNVDKATFTTEEVIDFAADYDLILLKYDGRVNEELEIQDFTLKLLKIHWTVEREKELETGCTELFDLVYVAFCKNCQLVYSPSDTSPSVSYRHTGKKLEFRPGVWEEVDMDDVDDPVVIEKWSCCGEVAADEQGCEAVPAGPHVLDDTKRDFCRFSIRTSTVFPK